MLVLAGKLYESVSIGAWVHLDVVLALEIWHEINQPVPAHISMVMKQVALSHTRTVVFYLTKPQQKGQ